MTFTKWAPWSCYGPEIQDGQWEIAVVPPRTEDHEAESAFYKNKLMGNPGELSAPSYASRLKRPHGLHITPPLRDTSEIVDLDSLSAVNDQDVSVARLLLEDPFAHSSFAMREDEYSPSRLLREELYPSSANLSPRSSPSTSRSQSRARARAWSGDSRATTSAGEDVPQYRSESEVHLGSSVWNKNSNSLGPSVRRTNSDFVGGPTGHLGAPLKAQHSNPLGYSSAPLDVPRSGSEPLRMSSDARMRSERNKLDTLIATGDVIAVRGNDRISRIGASGGFMGHVLVVLAPPKGIHRESQEAIEFMKIWPDRTSHVYQIKALESVRGHATGLHNIELLCYVEELTGKILLLGEISDQDVILKYEHDVPEILEFWQCPQELRAANRVDLMEQVLSEMKSQQTSWSWSTAVRAFLLPSGVMTSSSSNVPSLHEIQECWKAEPICTSVVIAFWQRYLCKLAHRGYPFTKMTELDLILKWMPLKADRVLPGELLSALRTCKWDHIERLHPVKPKHRLKHHKDKQSYPDSWPGRTHL